MGNSKTLNCQTVTNKIIRDEFLEYAVTPK